MKKLLAVFSALVCGVLFAEDEMCDFDRWYVGGSAALMLPQGGVGMRRLGGGQLQAGYYLTDAFAVEGSVAWLEDSAGLGARGLWHWHGWEEFNLLFGYERLDPFFTVGARGWLGREGQVGPDAGIGALYYLTNSWALRGEADATLGLDGSVGLLYTLTLGLQYSF